MGPCTNAFYCENAIYVSRQFITICRFIAHKCPLRRAGSNFWFERPVELRSILGFHLISQLCQSTALYNGSNQLKGGLDSSIDGFIIRLNGNVQKYYLVIMSATRDSVIDNRTYPLLFLLFRQMRQARVVYKVTKIPPCILGHPYISIR
jgi:hypothetical protein